MSSYAKQSPHRLYQLQRDFELAGLEELIARFETSLSAGHTESHWQNLLNLNPFIISMLFGHPIVVVQDQAHVGGMILSGRGETIVDFLVRNQSTQNLALVEIKRPDTRLIGKEFRKGRFQPSNELNSAVIQIIDQKYELMINYKDRAKEAGFVHTVECVVVIGIIPSDAAQLASFEMYRKSFRNVYVITFDEILLKIRTLKKYLASTNISEKMQLF